MKNDLPVTGTYLFRARCSAVLLAIALVSHGPVRRHRASRSAGINPTAIAVRPLLTGLARELTPSGKQSTHYVRYGNYEPYYPQLFRRFEGRLLIVLASVFCLLVRFFSGCVVRGVPGVPGCAPAPTAPGWSSFRVAWMVGDGQEGAGRAQSRCQQARNASVQGQPGLILRARSRAWRASRAGMCQIR